MSIRKIEISIKLMKAQVEFLATRQKEQLSLNKKIIGYSKSVLEKRQSVKKSFLKCTNKIRNVPDTKYTFEVYEHLRK